MAAECNKVDERCRTCYSAAIEMYDIFADEKGGINPAQVLTQCTNLKIEKNDNLPQQVCGTCYHCLMSFYDFRHLAEKIDIELHNVINITKRKDDSMVENNNFVIDVKIEADNSYSSDHFCTNDNDLVRDEDNTSVKEEKYEIETKPHLCTTCLSHFNTDKDLRKHMAIHKNVLKCDICFKKFKKASKFEHHKLKHLETFACHICLETFKDRTKYAKHLVKHGILKETLPTEINQNTVVNEPVKCEQCSDYFKSVNALAAHKRKHTKKGRKLACSICGKNFQKISHVKRHELCHDVNRPFKCALCPKRFNTESLLKEHEDKHNNIKPHVCPICLKRFAHVSTLTNHVKLHTRDKLYLCPTCGKKFDSSTNLNQHMRRHLGLKVFACSLCPRKFVSKGELKSHTTTHTGERSHACDECGSTFTKRSSLEKHKLRHAGVKPHECDVCFVKFTTKDHLKRHYRIHTGEKPYKCDMCERAFTQSADLIKHKRSHLGENIYKCTECPASFRLHTELRQHLSEHFISSQLQALNVNKTTGEKETNARDGALNVVGEKGMQDAEDVLRDGDGK